MGKHAMAHLALTLLVCGATAVAGPVTPQGEIEDGDTVVGVETTDLPVTVSDLISYTGPYRTGTATVHLKKKDASDDINVLPYSKKYWHVGKCESWTISFMHKGKEMEMDLNKDPELNSCTGAWFDADVGGLYSIEHDFTEWAGEPLPPLEVPLQLEGGTIAGGQYPWITFYDVSASDGWIERDAAGHAISPFLPDGTVVTALFETDATVAIPEPATLALSAMALLGLGRYVRRRRLTGCT